MLPLETAFKDRQFRYQQVERQGDIAIYTQQHKASGIVRYECIRIQARQTTTWPNGTTTPAHEAYPGASSWGPEGWTFFSLEAAQKHKAHGLQGTTPVEPVLGEEE